MMPYLTTAFGNAASRNHLYGWEAEAAVDEARDRVAALLGASSAEIVFTSGATESNNLAIIGAARHYREKGNHVVTGATEHKAVLDSCKELEREGFEVTVLAPDSTGQVSAAQVADALTDRTVLVTLMLANNEIGTVHPLREIAAACRERGVLVHSDAVQGVGKIPFDVASFGIDLASITAHKIYGPKGCGALYVRGKDPRVRLSPLIHGGGHERGLRSGTLNVPGIVGLGKACELAASELPEESKRLRRLRNRLYEGITSRLGDVHLNGYPLPKIDAEGNLQGEEWRLPGNLNVSFGDVEGEALITGIRDVAVSSGAASRRPDRTVASLKGDQFRTRWRIRRSGSASAGSRNRDHYDRGGRRADLRARRPASQRAGACRSSSRLTARRERIAASVRSGDNRTMASVISHAVAAAAIGCAAGPPEAPGRFWAAVIACAVIPDLDAIGFRLGIPYGSVFGHRGITHSILFALLTAAVAMAVTASGTPAEFRNRVLLTFCLAALSHGLLDAATNGGLGVAFFSPFSNHRYFFPLRVIEVSPIGIRPFFSARGLEVLRSEAVWIWLPSAVLAGIVWIIRHLRGVRH